MTVPGLDLAARLLTPAAGDAATAATAGGAARSGPGFADRLRDLLAESDRAQRHAEGQARALVDGQGDVVETMVSLSKAELSLRLVTQIRDRALEAYHEIMRMQV